MKLRPPTQQEPMAIPALLAKRGKGGKSWVNADKYDTGKEGAEILFSSFLGATSKERAAEVRWLLADSKLKRYFDHWSISLDPRLGRLTDEQWLQVAQDFAQEMHFEGCAMLATRHVDEPHDHIHLCLLRVRPDCTTVDDSHDFKRSHAAAAKCAAAIGLTPLPQREDAATKLAPGDSAIAAVRRAKRRGTPTAKPGSVASAFDALVGRCTSVDELEARAVEGGLELQVRRKSGGEIQGINVRAIGVDEWEKASSLSRSLGWGAVQVRLAANAERRSRAQASADAANAAARERAERRVAERLAAQYAAPTPDPKQARALLPAAATAAKEAIVIMQNDKLDFLSPPPPPRPPGTPLDDAVLAAPAPVPFAPVAAPEAAELGLTARELADRDDAALDGDNAELALAAELRSATKTQLSQARQSLRSELAAAEADAIARFVTRLTRLVLRIATAGTVVLPPSEAERRAFIARQTIEQIDGELRRRADIATAREIDAFKTKPTSTQESAKSVQKLQVVRTHDPRQPATARDRDEIARQLDAERERNRS